MTHDDEFQPISSYQDGVRRTLRQVIDFMAVLAVVVIVLNLVRVSQFGLLFMLTSGVLLTFCVLPPLFLRDDRYLPVKGAMMVFGFVFANFVGITDLGLGAAAFVAFPFHMALCAALFSRRVTYLALAVFTCCVIACALLFVQGHLQAPPVPLVQWNQSASNWGIMLVSLTVTNVLVITLVYNQSRFWRLTDSDAYEKARQFEALVEYAPDAITILDVDTGHFVAINTRAEELFGKSREDLVGKMGVGQVSPERQPSGETSEALARAYVEQALAGAHPTFEWHHTGADGNPVPCEISLSRIPPFDRNLVRGNIANIANRLAEQQQRETLQMQLAAAQRLETIGQLTGGVAHDFNNLLAVILGNLELLQDECGQESIKARLQPCIDATLRGADLTRSMLSYARQAQLEPHPLDLNRLVRETKNWAGRTLPTSIEIETSLLARLWTVEADPGVAESALLNLILNARDAMPAGGKLTIETSNVRIDELYVDNRNEELVAGRYVMVAVSDTGSGIAQESLERIFDPFFTTKSPGKGSGLGLPMVLGFMRQSGGTVQVYSEPGVGSTFKLYFPATAQHEASTDLPKRDTLPDGRGKRILIAEDEEEVLTVLTAMLGASGYEVTEAKTGDQAKAIFDADPHFDLLLTDIVMPGTLQGTSLARELRAITSSLPVIFMSGYASEATVHGNGLRPEDIRLMKPVMRRDLLDAVARALQSGPGASRDP